MTITQTVEVPASHRLIIDVPREVPAGPVVLAFTPATDRRSDHASSGTDGANEVGEGCPICAKLRDPVTGEMPFNAETRAAFEEGDAILRGEIPAKRYSSLEEMLADLDSDDDEDDD